MDFILWCLNIAWKILVICIGVTLFRYVLKNGRGTFRELLDTIGISLKAMGHAIRKWCYNYLKKESADLQEKREETEATEPEKDETVKVTIDGHEIQYANFEEFRDAFVNREPFVLK